MISLFEFEKLVEEYAEVSPIETYVCVGHGINFKVRGVEVPFSLIDLLGIKYEDLYQPTEVMDENLGIPVMLQGFFGATEDQLYYIKNSKYDWIIHSLCD